jgi:hypothetical protein
VSSRIDARAAMADGLAAFEAAAKATGTVVSRTYTIASLTVTLRFAGSALVERLSAALEHHPHGKPDDGALIVSIWDTASTGVPLPPFPADAIDGGTTGVSRIAPPPAVRAKYRPDQRSLSLLDRAANRAVFCVADPAALASGETGAPLRVLFHWWMADHGRQLVHAGAVGTATGGFLLAGKGGSGKSSTALACLGSGLDYAADDYCLVSVDPTPRVHSLYSSAKLAPDQARRFPQLASVIVNPDKLDTEKAVFLVNRRYPEHIQQGFQISAIVVPVISNGPSSRLERAPAGTALRALAPSTILQLPGAGRAALATLSRLAWLVPTFVLRLGHDLDAIPAVLAHGLVEARGS